MYQSREIPQTFTRVGHQTQVYFLYGCLQNLVVILVLRDILTRNSFLNAIVIVNILGGSTNAVRCHCTSRKPNLVALNV